ncbi:uncharacterized protein LOC124155239 [Ischnura elegans]|uniref:uncharacterized protein LOC124155239 n=1 Tax=Ischnura elegans TaxID=197161 RepID=UPI001ED8BAC9|nr:uncharacterized protein LOC124155239 [Ischnura elegans]
MALDALTDLCDGLGSWVQGITISVQDTHPSEPPSKMHLSATSFHPAVDFSAVDRIFIENVICEDFQSFKFPSKAISYVIYSKKDNELAYKGVYVNHAVEARICLHNCSLIPADVEISIGSCDDDCSIGCYYLNKDITEKKRALECFEVTPKFVKIPPCSDEWITISFSPCGTEASVETYMYVWLRQG